MAGYGGIGGNIFQFAVEAWDLCGQRRDSTSVVD